MWAFVKLHPDRLRFGRVLRFALSRTAPEKFTPAIDSIKPPCAKSCPVKFRPTPDSVMSKIENSEPPLPILNVSFGPIEELFGAIAQKPQSSQLLEWTFS